MRFLCRVSVLTSCLQAAFTVVDSQFPLLCTHRFLSGLDDFDAVEVQDTMEGLSHVRSTFSSHTQAIHCAVERKGSAHFTSSLTQALRRAEERRGMEKPETLIRKDTFMESTQRETSTHHVWRGMRFWVKNEGRAMKTQRSNCFYRSALKEGLMFGQKR